MEIKPQRYRLALVLNSLFFPLTFPESIESLSKRGFSVGPFPPRTLIYGNRSYIGGRIAEKQNVFLEINNDRKMIACEGTDKSEVISTLNEIQDMLYTDFSVSIDEIDYLELNLDVVVVSNNNPFQRLTALYQDMKVIKEFEKVLEKPLSILTVSLTPKDTLPSNKKWFDIRIEPRLTKPNEEYYINIVFRNSNLDEVLTFSKNVESLIIKILSIIEGE